MKLMLLLTLFVTSPLLSMELATPAAILSQPNIIKLIAYALVNTTPQGILVDDSAKNCKQLLATFQNFASTNKKIHDIIYKLRCDKGNVLLDIDQESIDFNCHFYTRMGSQVITAAFMGTPWALNIILDDHFTKLNNKYGKGPAIREFNILLGARGECIAQYAKLDITEMPPGYRGTLPYGSIITGYDYQYESIIETIKKFPPSTRQFILNLMNNK